MRISQDVRDKLQPLDRACFEKIKDSEFKPPYDLFGLKYLRDKAGNERNMRELYRGRAPYELLQNADDADATKVAFILTEDGMAFVHDGHWFTVDNFRSLADGWSDKDPSQCIGHKGLGFRSVLDITPAPFLVRVEPDQFFAIKFTWALNDNHVQQTLRHDTSLRSHYERWTSHGQLACPVMAIPGLARKRSLGSGARIFDLLVRGHYGDHFTTMFWFPARDDEIDRRVLNDLGPISIRANESGRQVLLSFLEDEVSALLPFLSSVDTVAVNESEHCIGSTKLSRSINPRRVGEITVQTRIGEQIRSESFFQMEFAFDIPSTIRHEADTPKAVKAIKEAKVVLSVRLKDDQPLFHERSGFHVYFPTEERTGVGFVVHGDFFVKPDRTRLMSGRYNKWLLESAATEAANGLLTQLLEHYDTKAVYEALSPADYAATDAAEDFVSFFAAALQSRAEPFVPTDIGLLPRDQVILPPEIDQGGFWVTHFSDAAKEVVDGIRAFLDPEVDGIRSRAFLRLAGIVTLDHEAILTFIERASRQVKPADWWYECYVYMATDQQITLRDHSFFAGHRLIPAADAGVIAVQEDGMEETGLVVCLPPTGYVSSISVPDCFSSVFVFVDRKLATLLGRGEDTVQNWVLNRFRISRFEATDLLPRAIRGVAPKIFSGELRIHPGELRKAWYFLKQVVDQSRTEILAERFWQDIGRFPLPLDKTASEAGPFEPDSFVPAFLAYWPDSFTDEATCLDGVQGLRRVNEGFLNSLILGRPILREKWIEFLERVGVSSFPKLLKFGRIVARGQDVPFVVGKPSQSEAGRFIGERQFDENRAVIDILRTEGLWNSTVESAELCNHDSPKILQSLTVLEGLDHCTQRAQYEYENRDQNWLHRLWSLTKTLGVHPITELEDDTVFCRGGSQRGHSVSIGSYLQRQLDDHNWLPSSHGPVSSSKCFVRLSSKYLISSGRADEELGDVLLPYVIVDNGFELERLKQLGVEPLDEAASATSPALLRALALLGERLATEWGRTEIMQVRSRWRLVRGAIQEIYRALNQRKAAFDCPENIEFATREGDEISFKTMPVYYAEPGSAVEQAFLGALALFDADRAYAELFETIGVTRLNPGQTVEETFLAEESSVPARRLRDEIATQLAPHLLAPIIAKSDKSDQAELAARRLERFEVKAVERLTVSYSLVDGSCLDRTIEFRKFYLQRRLLPGPGAIQEAHFTLFVVGDSSISLFNPNLDADALGEALAPIMLDGTGDELAGLLPRIASRCQRLKGDREGVQEYLYRQLGISLQAQDMARAMISGEMPTARAVPLPPPAKVVAGRADDPNGREGDPQKLKEAMQKHREELNQKADNLMENLANQPKAEQNQRTGPGSTSTTSRVGGPTPEQEARGELGEEEIKRRLEQPDGWEGFTLLSDVRTEGCGHDFLCAFEDREVQLEIKTFTPDGRVFVSSTELRKAATSQDDFYLVGVLDDGKPAQEWKTFIIRDPISVLLAKGAFDLQATLKASAADVFELRNDT